MGVCMYLLDARSRWRSWGPTSGLISPASLSLPPRLHPCRFRAGFSDSSRLFLSLYSNCYLGVSRALSLDTLPDFTLSNGTGRIYICCSVCGEDDLQRDVGPGKGVGFRSGVLHSLQSCCSTCSTSSYVGKAGIKKRVVQRISTPRCPGSQHCEHKVRNTQ